MVWREPEHHRRSVIGVAGIDERTSSVHGARDGHALGNGLVRQTLDLALSNRVIELGSGHGRDSVELGWLAP